MSAPLILFIVALFSSSLAAFAGGGSALFTLPTMILMGMPFAVALGTHTLGMFALALGSGIKFTRLNYYDMRYLFYYSMVGIPGSMLGANLIIHLPDRLAQSIIGVVLVAFAVYSFQHKELGQIHKPKNRHKKGMVIGLIIVFFIATYKGAFQAGSSLFFTMLNVRWFGMDYKRAVAYTSLVVALPWNAAAAATFVAHGKVEWALVPLLFVGFFAGSYFGAHYAILKGNKLIKHVIELVSLVMGLKLIFG